MTNDEKQKRKNRMIYIVSAIFLIFIFISKNTGFQAGEEIGEKFLKHSRFIFSIMPAIFLLLGLFKVWVKNETVMKHLGENSGVKGYLWALLLAASNIGGLFVSAPVAYTIHQKGAKLSIVLSYLGASCVCRVPMTLWEASMLGIQFTIIRFIVSIPLIIGTSILIEHLFFQTGFFHILDKEE